MTNAKKKSKIGNKHGVIVNILVNFGVHGSLWTMQKWLIYDHSCQSRTTVAASFGETRCCLYRCMNNSLLCSVLDAAAAMLRYVPMVKLLLLLLLAAV